MKNLLLIFLSACVLSGLAHADPLLVGKSPADNSLNNPYNSNIVATFDENILTGAGTITLKNPTNPSRSRTISATDTTQVSISGSVLTIDPIVPLDADTDYAVQFSPNAVQNISNVPYAGIPETDVTSWNFRTGSPSVVDVLVVYTPATLAYHGTEAGILAYIQGCIAVSNEAYARSGVTGQVRLAGTQLVNYAESSTDYLLDLNRLTNMSDGIMDNVHSLRNSCGADLVCLLRKGGVGATAGLAWRPVNTAGEPNRGFSVVTTEGALTGLTFTHELGHNMGLGHARDDSQGNGIFVDSSGYRFNGLSGTQYRTIMATAPGARISHFSNPDITFDGVATGVGPPSASNSANAARTLSIMMPVIEGYRSPATSNAPPTWSGNPFSAWDATVGQPYQTDLEINSADLNSDALTHTLVSGPAWLSITDSTMGRVVGTPTTANLGLNEFTVRISDGVNPAVESVMRINVLAETGGTWLGSSGNWDDTSVWSGGTIANGAGSTANFTGMDIAADQTIAVTLGRTIGNIIFTDVGASSNNLTISGTSSLTLDVSSGPPTIHVPQAERTLTFSNRISGSKGLRKMGSGTLKLSGNNSYTGDTSVIAGTLRLEGTAFSTTARNYVISPGAVLHNANSQIPSGTTTISGGGTLRGSFTNAVGNFRFLNLSMGAGGLIDVPSGDSIFNGGWNAISWDVNLATLHVDGSVDIWDGNAITAAALSGAGSIVSTYNGGTGADFNLGANNGSGTFSGSITATGTRVISLVKSGTGTQTFSGTSTFRGTTTINGGTLHFAKASSLYAGATSNWVKTKITVNNGGTIAFNIGGTNEFTADNVTTLLTDLGGSVNNNGLRSGSTIAFDTTNGSGGTFTISNTIADTIGTGGGAVGLRKLGANTLVLSTACTYTGPTTVDQGTLSVTGSLGATPVSVNGGTLSGNGSFGGNVTIAAGATHSLAVAATPASQDTSAITGTLAMEGSTLELTAASPPAAGVYVLATATAGITGAPASIHYNDIKGTVSIDTANTPNRLILTITPYNYWAATHASTGNTDDDFDNDGVANAIEFVLGGDKDTNDTSKLPSVAIPGADMTFSFVRDRASVGPGVSVTIEVGTNLTTWPEVFTVGANTATSSPGIIVTDTGNGTDTISLMIPRAPGTHKFVRLKVAISQ